MRLQVLTEYFFATILKSVKQSFHIIYLSASNISLLITFLPLISSHLSEMSNPLKTPGPQLEEHHVHQVYQEIASHFSDTRYKPWPIVEKYLTELPTGSLGLDVGCGNGKYLNVNRNVSIIGSDRSSELVKIARDQKNAEVLVSDALTLPFPQKSFDFAISIAVIHHFSTRERRIEAVRTILDLLNHKGTALIYVWALEQKHSRRGWDRGMEQDVMVPWVLNKKKQVNSGEAGESEVAEKSTGPKKDDIKLRYYHLYKSGELEEDVESAGGRVIEHGYEKDNWWAVVGKK